MLYNGGSDTFYLNGVGGRVVTARHYITSQLLVYADYINILGGSVNTVKNAKALVVASKDTGPEVNVNKTKFMVMSRGQNAGRSHNIEIYNNSFERVEDLKYLGTTITNKNSIQ